VLIIDTYRAMLDMENKFELESHWTSCRLAYDNIRILKKYQSYHRGAVLKEEFPEKTNCIFGISMVENLRRRWDLVGVPSIISKKKFCKVQCILNVRERKKNSSLWIRTSVAFIHAVY